MDDYNAAALELLGAKPDVQVADLNAAVLDVCGKGYTACNLQRWQNVHFTDAGKQVHACARAPLLHSLLPAQLASPSSQFCAVTVAHAVAPLLAPKWSQLWHA